MFLDQRNIGPGSFLYYKSCKKAYSPLMQRGYCSLWTPVTPESIDARCRLSLTLPGDKVNLQATHHKNNTTREEFCLPVIFCKVEGLSQSICLKNISERYSCLLHNIYIIWSGNHFMIISTYSARCWTVWCSNILLKSKSIITLFKFILILSRSN